MKVDNHFIFNANNKNINRTFVSLNKKEKKKDSTHDHVPPTHDFQVKSTRNTNCIIYYQLSDQHLCDDVMTGSMSCPLNGPNQGQYCFDLRCLPKLCAFIKHAVF